MKNLSRLKKYAKQCSDFRLQNPTNILELKRILTEMILVYKFDFSKNKNDILFCEKYHFVKGFELLKEAIERTNEKPGNHIKVDKIDYWYNRSSEQIIGMVNQSIFHYDYIKKWYR